MDEQESDDITIELQDSPNVVGSDVEDLILRYVVGAPITSRGYSALLF